MNGHNKLIVRRTDSQERFEALWEKRISGNPTLKELAEMDEIINRDPLIQDFVLQELQNRDTTPDNGPQDTPTAGVSLFKKLTHKIKVFFKRHGFLLIIETGVAVN